jgi:PAS domain S-box-containing protein
MQQINQHQHSIGDETCLRAMFDASTDASLVVNAQGIIVMANTAAAHLWGSEPAEMLGTPVTRWIPAWHLAKSHTDSCVLDDGAMKPASRALPSPFIALRGDGQTFPVEVEHSRVDADGVAMYSLVARRTTANCYEWVDQLDSAARLIASMASEHDATCITDAEGGLVHFNKAFASLHGLDSLGKHHRDPASHRQWLSIYTASGDLMPVAHNPVSRALRGEVGVAIDYNAGHQDADENAELRYNFAPIRSRDGAVVGAVVIVKSPERAQPRCAMG